MQASSQLQPGTMIAGRFQIVRFVAAGGMGAIYEALQMPLRRKVALKVIRQELAKEQMLTSRFEREAETVARLTHSHTITLFDYGITPEGVMFIAMEWLDGTDLNAELHRVGAIEPVRAARIAAQVARSLSEAHAIGVVHRDLKPENIFLIEREGQKDFVKVLDFGIVKNTSDARTQITRIGTVCGTPDYMSPEQARGENLDGRSDLYALGTVLYTMLRGEPPFQAESMLQIVMAHQSRSFPELGPHVPETLKAIIQCATAKAVAERYPSAEVMAADLEDFATGYGAAHVYPPAAAPGETTVIPELQRTSAAANPPASVAAAPAYPPPAQPTAPATPTKAFPVTLVVAIAVTVLLIAAGAAAFFFLIERDPAATAANDATERSTTATEQSPASAPQSDPPLERPSLTADDEADDPTPADPTPSPVVAEAASATVTPALPEPTGCATGMVATGPKGECCWPGQRWAAHLEACAGYPEQCREQLIPSPDGCIPAPAALAAKVRRCHEGLFSACESLMAQEADLDRVHYYMQQAQKAAIPACDDEGDSDACLFLATLYTAPGSTTAEITRGLAIFEKACDQSDETSCFMAYMAAQSLNRPADRDRLGAKLCKLSPESCDGSVPKGTNDWNAFMGDDFNQALDKDIQKALQEGLGAIEAMGDFDF